jgi:N-hydroxyarylamine O-acetyltransferase
VLEIGALQEKLVARRRGGYCFEHNSLFAAVLDQLGFRVTRLSARVVWMATPGAPPSPRTHMLLSVDVGGAAFVADVGFGGCVALLPLRFDAGPAQPEPGAPMRLSAADGSYTLSVLTGAEWRDAYRFTREPCVPADYEVANWYTSTHPASHFRHNLVLERARAQVRIKAFNRRVTRRFADGRSEEIVMRDADELAVVLDRDFGIDPPADPATIFARLPA